MDYVIRNNKGVFIRLDEKGKPITCSEHVKAIFTYDKAHNILSSLPKPLQKLDFRVDVIPDIQPKKEISNTVRVISSKDESVITENIARWIEKFGSCDDVMTEARNRKTEIITDLRTFDKEFLDLLHIIEIEKQKDLFSGWKLYKQLRENRVKRRELKDELLIINNVLGNVHNTHVLRRDIVQKSIDGLSNRLYTFRVEDADDEIM